LDSFSFPKFSHSTYVPCWSLGFFFFFFLSF
jgi:hypothetical protein